jgi:hypothetical protein
VLDNLQIKGWQHADKIKETLKDVAVLRLLGLVASPYAPPPLWWLERPTREDEIEDLKEHIEILKEELKAAEENLKELEKSK